MQLPRPPWSGRLGPAQRAVADGLTAAALVAVATVVAWQSAGPHGSRWVDAVVFAAAVAGGAMRRGRPRTALALTVAVAVLATGSGSFPAPWVAVAFVMYAVPQRIARREAIWLLVGSVAAAMVGLAGLLDAVWARPGPNRVAMLTEILLLLTVAWTIGYAVRQQALHTAGLREQEAREAQARLAEARRAMSEERLRIARELHDVVAHTLSLIAVQAGVANHVAAERPDEAGRALLSIEETSRDALREMRSMLGVLRAGPLPASGPGLDDLDELVRRTADAGLVVDLQTTGARPELPTGLDLVAYRIIQEAVTNVLRHAATDRCRVTVGFRPDALTLEIADGGPGAPAASGGHGIDGMRERVDMYGGTFTAGPAPDRGFTVRATFPLTLKAAA
ncbi:sensor histidine kinase [Dactylosporangium siamense]|uniref:histidine kinase n=1 Tax=Dactylosporangium siamense TaxID=685454 RepID=A0A919UEK0_9ACTN|nr:sensor histidine kinase [Dactylosporangium siamense]GIG49151.1 hypothetical protein Dsi01nite_071920 [Dactylosporangium siamense]